ncbi:MAG: cation diffusion facilitator family transporter [Gammaproteobacteria bacterium]|nr:cation diffusion facilitator family transporter [Gammaproteobacteria bacterium]
MTDSAALSNKTRRRAIDKVIWIGVAINILQTLSKIIGGVMTQSQALVADGIHSLSDLITDGMVLLASKHAHAEADEDHPYGHGRYETIATVALGMLLIFVAIGIAIDASLRLMSDQVIAIPGPVALAIAAFSILSNEGMFRYAMNVARRIKSTMLEANAWHSRSDALSSIVVLIGLAGTMLGMQALDAIAAITVALMIARMGWKVSHSSVQELVDTALDNETVDAIKQHINAIDDVKHLHMLRTRKMADQALVDVHIQVSSKLSVSEGHRISEAVEQTLRDNFDEINDVTVHIDAENDESIDRSLPMPALRKELLPRLKEQWRHLPVTAHIDNITLHYIENGIELELFLPLSVIDNLADAKKIQNDIRQASLQVHNIQRVDIFFH